MLPVVWIRSGSYPFRRLCRLHAYDVHRAWQLMEPSAAEFRTPINDPGANSDTVQPGAVVEILGDTADPWWGVLKPFEQSFGQPYIQWTAESMLGQLEERIVPRDLDYDGYAAGNIFLDLLNYAHRQSPLPVGFTPGTAGRGPGVTLSFSSGTTVLSAVAELAEATDHEFGMVPVRGAEGFSAPTYQFQYRFGFDRSGSVLITDAHLAGGTYSIDPKGTPALTRVITAAQTRDAVPGQALPAMTESAFPTNVYSRAPFTPGIGAVTVEYDLKAVASEARAARAMIQPRYGRELFELTLNARIDWGRIGLGDYVSVRLSSVRYGQTIRRKIRIMGLQPDEQAGELDIIGEVTE